MVLKVKTRMIGTKTYSSTHRFFQGMNWESDSRALSGHQYTESEGHPFFRLGKTSEDIGGYFMTMKWVPPEPAGYFHLSDGGTAYDWRGPLWAGPPPRVFDWSSEAMPLSEWPYNRDIASNNDLIAKGATAIARTTPTNPAFSAAAALGELREGIPTFPGRKALQRGANPKSLSDEYLNMEFGLKPMLSDARKLLDAHKNAEKILAQLYRDSGKLVRRKYSFPSSVDTRTEEPRLRVEPWSVGGNNSYNTGLGTLSRTHTTTRKFWFSGGYTYLFPRQEGWHRKIAELEKVYGVIPDVNDLWQLTPWSWAVDWVSNAGDLIQNLNSFTHDNLVLRFGYIMCQTDYVVHDTWHGPLCYPGRGWVDTELRTSYSYCSKQRMKATPYGFGLSVEQFSNTQKAIIAALGISKGSR